MAGSRGTEPVTFIGLLVAFEAVVGVLILSRGRGTQLAIGSPTLLRPLGDLDPSLVHRLEPLRLLLRILVLSLGSMLVPRQPDQTAYGGLPDCRSRRTKWSYCWN